MMGQTGYTDTHCVGKEISWGLLTGGMVRQTMRGKNLTANAHFPYKNRQHLRDAELIE